MTRSASSAILSGTELCMLSGFSEIASERFLLSDVTSGNIPEEFNHVFASL